MHRSRFAVLLALGVCAAAPAVASADDLCIDRTGCAPAKTYTAGQVSSAFTDAAPGDRVLFGAGSYDVQLSLAKALTVEGAGRDATTLRNPADSSAVIVSTAALTMRDLRVSGSPNGMGLGVAGLLTLRRVDVTNPTGSTVGHEVFPYFGPLDLDDVTVTGMRGVQGVTPFVGRRLKVDVDATAVSIGGGSGTGRLFDSELNAGVRGMVETAADMVVRGVIVRAGSSGPAISHQANGKLVLDRVTTSGGSDGVVVRPDTGGTAEVDIDNSLLGTADGVSLRLQANGGGSLVAGRADYSLVRSQAGGAFSQGDQLPPSTDARLDPVTLRPRFDSPLIDRGTPSGAAADGEPALVDGDGNGSVIRDIGAFEYQRATPVAAAVDLATVAAPATAQPGVPVTYQARSTDGDIGELLSHTWDFGDGGTATGSDVGHTFAAPGTYAVKVTATDPSGLTNTATYSVVVPAPAPAATPTPGPVPTPSATPTPTPTPAVVPTKETTATVGSDLLVLTVPKACVKKGAPLAVRFTTRAKKRKGKVVVKVSRLELKIDGKVVKTLRKAPFRTSLSTSKLKTGTHKLRATAHLKVRKGPQRRRSVEVTVAICR